MRSSPYPSTLNPKPPKPKSCFRVLEILALTKLQNGTPGHLHHEFDMSGFVEKLGGPDMYVNMDVHIRVFYTHARKKYLTGQDVYLPLQDVRLGNHKTP